MGLKTYDEIKHTLVDELGFRDLDAYRKWIAEERQKLSPTRERIEMLSPDVVDCRDFWRVCDELFGIDPVCNVAVSPEVGRLRHEVKTPMDANRLNLRFARSLGVVGFLDENAGERLNTLEIGPGYGGLKNYIETHTSHLYTGIDVAPRVAGILQTTAEGTIPPEFVEVHHDTFSYVVSSNVFQHLSARQRTQYYRDARILLHDGGLFIFNILVDTGKTPPFLRDQKGNSWCDHYGQFTLIPKGGSLYEELSKSYGILYVTQRYDGIFNFVCQKKSSSGAAS